MGQLDDVLSSEGKIRTDFCVVTQQGTQDHYKCDLYCLFINVLPLISYSKNDHYSV